MLCRGPDKAVDVYVGNRVRMRRNEIGLSQTELGAALSLSFQQVQKYERGANRISASKLYAMAYTLGVEVGYFFEGLSAAKKAGFEKSTARYCLVQALMSAAGGEELAAAFVQIRKLSVQRAVINLVKAIADDQGGELKISK